MAHKYNEFFKNRGSSINFFSSVPFRAMWIGRDWQARVTDRSIPGRLSFSSISRLTGVSAVARTPGKEKRDE